MDNPYQVHTYPEDSHATIIYTKNDVVFMLITTDYQDTIRIYSLDWERPAVYAAPDTSDVVTRLGSHTLLIQTRYNYFERDFCRFNELVFGVEGVEDFIFDTQSLMKIKEKDYEKRIHNRASKRIHPRDLR